MTYKVIAVRGELEAIEQPAKTSAAAFRYKAALVAKGYLAMVVPVPTAKVSS